MAPDSGHHHRHAHDHGVMTGPIVVQYDLLIARLLMRPVYARMITAVTREMSAGGAVLDVGTGPGRLVTALARRRPDLTVVGVDPSADMLTRARRSSVDLANASFVEAPAEALPVADGSQQVVLSSLSSHHWSDAAAALAEQARVLAPGGRLWLFDLTSHVGHHLADQIAAAGLTPTTSDPGLGIAGRWIKSLSAVKP